MHGSAARQIREAQALFIGAGAGMGVDSGLPDFRGDEGFWRAYPAFAELGLSFVDLANPAWFDDDPELAWGFYGHRLELYRRTEPHEGFSIPRRWAEGKRFGAFVFTSNVDGQFQRAGFPADRIVECHGSIHHFQCSRPCSAAIREGTESIDVDGRSCRAAPPLPTCLDCGEFARPNILMFGDGGWNEERSSAQERRLRDWLAKIAGQPLAVVELGAGTAVPTVRLECERVARAFGASLIRINPRQPHGPEGTLSFPSGALEALTAIDAQPAG